MKARELCRMGLLTGILTLLGCLRLPSFFPGAEFQLSAPFAVALCAALGFRRYILIGVLSSCIALLLGLQSFLHVGVALLFRLAVGVVLQCGRNAAWAIVLAGPAGSAAARLGLGFLIGKAVYPLLLAALPGMLLTALAAYPMTKILRRMYAVTEGKQRYVVQR